MSLVQFLRIFYARWPIIVTAVLACFVIATVTAFVIPKRYQATTRVLLNLQKPDPVTGEVMGEKTMYSYVRTQSELISDYRTAGRVVDALGWVNDPGLVTAYEKSGETEEYDLRRWLAQRIIGGTASRLVPGTSIMEIAYTSSTPDSAKQIADLIRNAYFEETLRFRRSSASRVAEWYGEQTDRALNQVRQAEQARNDFARANGIVLDSANVDLESAKLQALTNQSAMASVVGNGTVVAPATGVSPLDQIDAQIAQAAMTLGPNHPQMVALKRQRQVLASASFGGGGRTGPSAGQIESAFSAQKSRVLGQSGAIDKLRQMQTEIDLRRDQYLKTSQRVADYQLQSNASETSMEPLGEAVAPETPSFPNIPGIIGGSSALGLGLGLCLALLTELLARRVRSDHDLSYATDAPVFAVIGMRRDPNSLTSKLIRFLERKKNRESIEGAAA